MRKLFITMLVISLLITTSCNQWLDVTPKTEMKADVLFSKQAGFRDALIGVYGLMTSKSTYGSELSMAYIDVLAQTYDNVRGTSGHQYLNAANFDYAEVGEEARLLKIWKQQYKAIVNTNIIIERADENQSVFTGENYSLVKGEALALRAFLHLDLLRMFGPIPATGLGKMAIPYVNAYTNIAFSQSTVKEVLEKIIEDLEQARMLLKKSDPYGPNRVSVENASLGDGNRSIRMNYYAATAVMARAYLYVNDKENALIAAKEVIESGLFPSFEFSTDAATKIEKGDYIFPTEHVFAISIKDLKTQIADQYFPESYNNVSISALSLKNTNIQQIFPVGVNTDYRNNWFETSSTSTKRVSKYTYNVLIPLIKISELYLIASEAEPTLSKAIAYMNELKIHRGLSALDVNTVNQAMLTTEINEEYRREFISEGQLFYYYKRKNVAKMPTIPQFTNLNKVYELPIPKVEIEFGNIEESDK